MFTELQIEEFRRDGFTLFPDFFSGEEVALYRNAIEEVSAGNTLENHDGKRMEMEPSQPPEGKKVRRLYEPCSFYSEFKELSGSAKLLDCVEQLIGPDIVLHYSKINMKPAEIGSVVEWHQDISYYPLTNLDSIAILFYLDDATVSNGCLKVIPGRQNSPLMNHSRDGYFQGRVTEEVDDSLAVPVEGKAGSAIFMHCMVPHASLPNTSSHSRRTLILSYRSADAFPIYHSEMTHKNEAGIVLVRGKWASSARMTLSEFPIPKYPRNIASLYDLQETSRKGEKS